VLHGEAVAWGLLAALRLARERGLVSRGEAQAWASRIDRLAPLPGIGALTWAELAPFVGRDKKRGEGRVGWVLPREGGVVMGVDVADDEARAAFAALQALPSEGPFASLF
jgi:3-dehydroquinate synthase